jgi:hypothetical protein
MPSGTVPLFVRVVNANSGAPISGAIVWLDGLYVGSADSFGIVPLSLTNPLSGHTYVVGARGYHTEKGIFTNGSANAPYFIVELTPNPQHQ